MTTIKLILTVMLMLGSTIALGLTEEDRAFLDFLKNYCGKPMVTGAPIPPKFPDVVKQAAIGCVAHYGMEMPCLVALTVIKKKDGSHTFNAVCGPMPPEPQSPTGELKIP